MNKDRARDLRRNLTEAEKKLWTHLRLRQIETHKFRRQQPVGQYIVDFICFEKRLIVEVDGGQHTEQIVYDTERTAWLKSQGFHLLRFWNHQVLQDIDIVKEVIYKVLMDSKGTPHPDPPPQGGRELKESPC